MNYQVAQRSCQRIRRVGTTEIPNLLITLKCRSPFSEIQCRQWVGGSIAGSAVGAASGEVISGMLKHFGKKKKKPPEPEEQSAVAANPASGSAVLFRISNELISVSDKKIDPGQFDAPASWEKVTVSAR